VIRSLRLVLGLLAVAALPVLPAAAREVTVLTALHPLHAMTRALAEGTDITVINLPERQIAMTSLGRALERDAKKLAPLFARADAVVSLRSVWPEDPLYPRARAANIRVVEIDAANPVGASVGGVSLLPAPRSVAPWRDGGQGAGPEGPSPYVWMSLSNLQRMAEIIAADLDRLAPDAQGRIDANLEAFKSRIRELRAQADARLLESTAAEVFVLSDQLDYLIADLGLFASGHFTEQGAFWQPEDHIGFQAMLAGPDAPVVLHHWEPDPEVAADIDRAGARLAVLDSLSMAGGDQIPPLTEDLAAMLETLFQAMNEAPDAAADADRQD